MMRAVEEEERRGLAGLAGQDKVVSLRVFTPMSSCEGLS